MVKHFINICQKILRHPLTKNEKIAALKRYFSWQFCSLFNKATKIVNGYNDIKLRLDKDSPSINAQYYFGLSDNQEMSFLLHFLKPDHIFIDIGANHGAYALLAQYTGASMMLFEPIPDSMERLQANLELNGDIEGIQFRTIAIGDVSGFLTMTERLAQQNHIVESDCNALLVEVNTLDNELGLLSSVCLIKIDVEGYDLKVLKGAINSLENKLVKAVIVEMMGLGERYDSSDKQVHGFLQMKGFEAYNYDPIRRELTILKEIPYGNGLYLRDIGFIEELILKAKP